MARSKTKARPRNQSACVLGYYSAEDWLGFDVPTGACGVDPPSLEQAGRDLANRRWQKSLRVQARDLRRDAEDVIAAARENNPSPDARHHAIAARLAAGEF